MEDRYKETHKTWNKMAQLYEDTFMELELYNDTYIRFCDLLLKPDSALLELGCGPGNITRQLLTYNPNLNILATDVSSNMIELAKKNNPQIEVRVLDCRDLATVQGEFDGIICGFTIPYLTREDCCGLILDCSRLLVDRGILYLSFVSGDYNKSGFVSGASGDRTYFYYHEPEKIAHLLESTHFNVIDLIHKEYSRSDGSSETHTIMNAVRMRG